MLKNILEHKELLKLLVNKELNIRYRNSLFGFLWTLLEPLGLMIVYTIVFSIIMRFGVKNYPLFLLAGLIPWMFISNSLNKGVRSLSKNSSLVKKVYFPREIFPLSMTITNLITFVMALFLVVIYSLVSGIEITIAKFGILILTIILQTVLAYGIVLFTSIINVYYKDIEYIIKVGLRAWMYLSPVIYPMSRIPEEYLTYFYLNPMSVIISLYRMVLYGESAPPAKYIILTVFTVFTILLLSWRKFKKLDRRVGEVI